MSPEPINFIPIPCVDMNLSEVNRAEQTTTAGHYWYVSTIFTSILRSVAFRTAIIYRKYTFFRIKRRPQEENFVSDTILPGYNTAGLMT